MSSFWREWESSEITIVKKKIIWIVAFIHDIKMYCTVTEDKQVNSPSASVIC